MFAAMTLTLLLTATPASLDDDTKDEVTLAWKREEGKTHFEEGKTAFEAEDYKLAYQQFKKALKLAKGRATKLVVKRWQEGARGGWELVELKKQEEAGNTKKVYGLAERNLLRYLETPIGKAYHEFVQSLQDKLFETLEDFDVAGKRYSEKYGKTFVDDPKLVKQGRRCLRWETRGKTSELKITRLPRDLSSFRAVSYWMYFDGPGASYQLVFKAPGKSKSDYGETMQNAFIKFMKPHSGWKRLEVPFKEFSSQGEVSWERIKDFRIQFIGGKKVTLFIDYVALVRS
ncbi:MAG: hypothetical protein ACE5GW_10090 [Planctomycetota bacterium]